MTLEQKIERAKQIRKTAMMNAETLEDAKAAEVPTLYPVWEAGQTLGRHCGQGNLDSAGGGHRLCAGQSWAVKEGWICLIAKS